MKQPRHWFIYTNNQSNKKRFLDQLYTGAYLEEYGQCSQDKTRLFSDSEIDRLISEEERHDFKTVTTPNDQPLNAMSSGEQKKALFSELVKHPPELLILDNPFTHLDMASQSELKQLLSEIATQSSIIQLSSRVADKLPFIKRCSVLQADHQITAISEADLKTHSFPKHIVLNSKNIPPPLKPMEMEGKEVIVFDAVNVSFAERPILQNINWTVNKGEFWQLSGKNGSGKTTLLSMITGENTKGYGQNLVLFGKLKGSGESLWEIKKQIGYVTPAMTRLFNGYHSVVNMVVSGLFDSVGLYQKPSDLQLNLAAQWLEVLNLKPLKPTNFKDLSLGQQRLVMIARAMIKHPPLLILDEPTADLDDDSAALFVALVNKIAQESDTAIIYVSHSLEPSLQPSHHYLLEANALGSTGKVVT
ncbi:ATP-binding cassette domain-containing protein [Subsaximicrobium wynnwilliamsii]|uniref:ATP-binding cassette domain-containing protein n=1 Tax=Subsaximicrobium wynnwilliamsii TaxID=291179 RepID=A0A5C6ZH36_9FLAO|nr:ATP-binding cassette domain-containing protein [Subsaximicrobium wynnwilliamsii]TXD84054.1 ATP-binding cassette domain-containing protein [Subsaximicrobium wynnwilliamsii]TXD88988.1 ATP-binding cassette domain-containing protein [Subsaximicrobium wynnwilliamsii]TXE03766.1 ATP-binding cassette domain-containing protein [Subsaximicrobium wynnwilliamsii]